MLFFVFVCSHFYYPDKSTSGKWGNDNSEWWSAMDEKRAAGTGDWLRPNGLAVVLFDGCGEVVLNNASIAIHWTRGWEYRIGSGMCSVSSFTPACPCLDSICCHSLKHPFIPIGKLSSFAPSLRPPKVPHYNTLWQPCLIQLSWEDNDWACLWSTLTLNSVVIHESTHLTLSNTLCTQHPCHSHATLCKRTNIHLPCICACECVNQADLYSSH